jgi:hypothetical protein
VLDYVDRNQRKRGLASASLKSGSMAASGSFETSRDVRSLSVEKRPYRGQGENDGVDPMQTFSKEPLLRTFAK